MKRTLFLGAALILSIFAMAQSSREVHWNYKVKKLSDKTYEIRMSATINGDYHLYAQDAGGEGPVATTFTFSQNPLVTLDGKVKEEGKAIRKFESAWKHDVKYYERTVDFVQIIKLKANVKTDFSGKVEFMVCNDRQCLPPAEVEIKVNVGG